ncbi:DUF5677 domain-containing protein [Burkholderia ambifaria]|uniref:DUF5677 domain-containing protein n=1 Tax=Burkholderia ambifaria TaxID=152480 RepID=UPI00158BC48F|nr:DUF5677 domain-containing protein [Burkholderia ambifaria]
MSQNQGFISANPTLRHEFSPWFNAAERFNALAMQVLPNVKPASDSNQQVVAAALYGRALASYQAAFLLAERGLISDARTVVRAAAETVIILSAVVKDSGVCDLLFDRHVWHHAKLRRAWLNDPQALAHMTPDLIATVKKTLAEIEAQFSQAKALKKDPVAISDLAKKAEVMALYNGVYRLTSGDAAHTTLDSLNRHIRVDSNGDIAGMKFGPSGDDLPQTLADAMSVLGFALHAVADLFQIPDLIDNLTSAVAEYKALGVPTDAESKQS